MRCLAERGLEGLRKLPCPPSTKARSLQARRYNAGGDAAGDDIEVNIGTVAFVTSVRA